MLLPFLFNLLMVKGHLCFLLFFFKKTLKKAAHPYKGTRSFISRGTTQISISHYAHFVSLTQIYGKNYLRSFLQHKRRVHTFLGTVYTNHCLSNTLEKILLILIIVF